MKFTIIRTQTIKTPDLARAGQDDVWVIYSGEDGRIGSVTIPANRFTEEFLAKAIKLEEERHGRLRGKTLEA